MKCGKMRKYIGITLMTCLLTPSLGVSGETDGLRHQLEVLIEQNKQLTQRISEIEKKLASQEAEPMPSGERQSFLQTITDSVEISGLIEVEVSSINDDINDEDTSDITLATIELGIDASLSEWARGHLLLLYEEGEEDDHIIVDEGTISLSNDEKCPGYLTVGKMYLPFGSFESNMISDPLTLEIGEIGDSAVQFGYEANGFYGSIYAFNGDINETGEDDEIDTFGVNLGFGMENETMTLDVGVDWISNIGDTDGIGDYLDSDDHPGGPIDEIDDYVAGLSLHAVFSTGPFTIIGEYVTALDEFEVGEIDFDDDGAEPEAWNLEAAFSTELFNRETTFALGYQLTDEAVALGLPEDRYLGAVSMAFFDNTSLAFEYLHDEDYGESDGGTGDDADSATMQLAVEF